MLSPRILICSLGSIGRRHLENTRKLLPHSKIAVLRLTQKQNPTPDDKAVVLQTIQAAQEFNPECIIISSPATFHHKFFIDISQSAHVLIEKPLSHSVNHSLSITKHNNTKHNSFCMLGYVLRFSPVLYKTKELIQENKIGTPLIISANVGQHLPSWRPHQDYRSTVSAQKKLGGGALLELSHELDYVMHLFGTPEHVFCSMGTLSNLEIDVEDSANLILEYSDPKRRITLNLDFIRTSPERTLTIIGEKGVIKADFLASNIEIYDSKDRELKIALEKPAHNELYLKELDYFFSKSFRGEYSQVYCHENHEHSNLSDGLKVNQLISNALKSNQTGQRIPFKSHASL